MLTPDKMQDNLSVLINLFLLLMSSLENLISLFLKRKVAFKKTCYVYVGHSNSIFFFCLEDRKEFSFFGLIQKTQKIYLLN